MIRTSIVTPFGPVFEGLATGVNLPGTEGAFEVKFNHASLMSMLDIGKIIIRQKDGAEHLFAVNGGFVEVHDNRVTVLAESAENVKNIDLERARAAKARAADEIRKEKDRKAPQEDVLKAELALKRAINRIKLHQLG
ncbi:MAG: ATP synthase F1 subunit epsilon [Balneolia bacterium]|nr:ATP synthase F1 subunit epsilon [Balneolia bacterium]